jgi:hypothetical protein
VAVLVACADRVDAPPYTGDPIVRDSAGITVVENPAGVRMLDLRETLGIGEVDGRHHDVFASDGLYVGTVETPLFPQVVHRDWMVTVVRDELGVQYVVRYELTSE